VKPAVVLVALWIICAGVAGVVAPESAMALRRYVLTPAGLLVIASIRIAVGVLFIMVAPRSRVPRILRALGGFLLLAGLVTPLFGVERARAIADWEAAQSLTLIRTVAVLVAALGAMLAFAVSGRRADHRP
jgi:uncharacterized membrane protein